jgi:CheY-like chemotaxis protein
VEPGEGSTAVTGPPVRQWIGNGCRPADTTRKDKERRSMNNDYRPAVVLLADDDDDDVVLIRDSFRKSGLMNDLRIVVDGVDLMDYLKRRGRFSGQETAPRPDIILLDLNMPRKSGREALCEIKADPELKDIPIIVLTTSQAHEDIVRSYREGAASFVTKPVTFESMCRVVARLGEYWFQIVRLPDR